MATAKPIKRPLPRATKARRIGLIAVIAVIAALVLAWRPLNGFAVTGASYGARVACSCRFVGGRSLGDCRKDFEPGMGLVMLSEDAPGHSVTARFPLLSTQTARFREGEGCVLDKWEG